MGGVKLAPAALAVAATVLVVPVLTGYAAQAEGNTVRVAPSFDASTITSLAANGVELTSAAGTPAAGDSRIDVAAAVAVAESAVGGDGLAAELAAFTDHNSWGPDGSPLSRQHAWQVVLDDTVLPSGERGRAWVALDATTGEVLAAHPLVERPGF